MKERSVVELFVCELGKLASPLSPYNPRLGPRLCSLSQDPVALLDTLTTPLSSCLLCPSADTTSASQIHS